MVLLLPVSPELSFKFPHLFLPIKFGHDISKNAKAKEMLTLFSWLVVMLLGLRWAGPLSGLPLGLILTLYCSSSDEHMTGEGN